MRALFVHHDPNSVDGLLGESFTRCGATIRSHQVCDTPHSPAGRTEFPDPTDFDAVVVFGSRWSVCDPDCAHWVEPEVAMLRAADAAGVAVLGCCFGGQILAAALGGTVAPTAHSEIGWMEVEPLPLAGDDRRFDGWVTAGPWLQWHGDAFTVPSGAVELATSAAGPQAFALRRNL
ncbi:MAG: type 1 glutamine amidotransferase, partial [Actinomycetes bacterium]